MLGVRLILVSIVYGAPVYHVYGVETDQEGKRIKRHLGHQQKVYNDVNIEPQISFDTHPCCFFLQFLLGFDKYLMIYFSLGVYITDTVLI